MTLTLPKSIYWIRICRGLFPCQLMCIMTSPFNWPWKTTRKWLLNCQNPSTGSKDTVKSIFLSADVTVGLALKNYPKIPLDQKLWSTYRFITIYLLHSFQQYLAADLSAVKQDEIENLLLGILCLSRFGWLLLWLQLSFVYTQEKRLTNRFRYTSWERSTCFGSDSMWWYDPFVASMVYWTWLKPLITCLYELIINPMLQGMKKCALGL